MNRSFVFLAITAILPGVLPACHMTGAGSDAVPALPVAWRNAAGFPVAAPDRDLSRWWTQFDDPLLTRVVSGALRSSPTVAAAAARVREARAQRKAQASTLFPSVDASATRRTSVTRVDAGPDQSGTTYSAGLNASWDADLFGANRQNVAAASAAAESAMEDYRSAQASLAAETALAYVDLRATESRLGVVRESLRTRKETTQLVTWRKQAGEVDNLELRQAESSLEQAHAALSSLEQAAAQTRNRLALLSGFAPGSLDGMLSSKSSKVPAPARRLAVGIPADTIRQRPDVRSTGYKWVAAVARKRSAEAEQLPSLRLTGTLGIDTLSASKIFNPQSAGASLISGLTGPIFNAGRIRAGIEAAGAVQEQALLAYQNIVLTALSEVEDALIACRRSGERIGILEKAATAAREADALARLRYRTGDTDISTVLDTERTLLSLEESLVSARADRASAHIQLYKALGGGWSAH
ncbi:MAG TPA: efflux transporter outer membrane subunit [Verrucomicrobiales bacterium]|nr:efflux transporter outer membrane subunit [Verrucomicrobiales bacterium]